MQPTMTSKRFTNRQKGFTLVELLIVVIILAILAAIVVPQFAASTEDARLSALDTNLANIRASLDLYYQQHGGRYPGEYKEADGTTKSSTAAEKLAAFKAQLTLYTNVSGKTANTKDATFKYGPYIKRADIPKNPITESNDLEFQGTGALGMTGVADPFATTPAKGWKYDVVTGQFIANDNRLLPGSTTERYDMR